MQTGIAKEVNATQTCLLISRRFTPPSTKKIRQFDFASEEELACYNKHDCSHEYNPLELKMDTAQLLEQHAYPHQVKSHEENKKVIR